MATPKLFKDASAEEMQSLSPANRARIRTLEKEMLSILNAPNKMQAYDAASERTCGLIPDVTGRRSLSPQSFMRIFATWKSEGWRALVAGYSVRKEKLPPAFLRHWESLYLKYNINRSGRSAHKELIKQWLAWRNGAPSATPIPGYPVPPEEFGTTGLPFGWSERNLMRHKPEKIVVAAVKKGRHAASQLAPMVLSTRAHLEPGMCYVFDDVWHDLKVSFPRNSRPELVRPIELGVIDLASGAKVRYGLRPRIYVAGEKPGDKGSYMGLRGTDMAMLVADLLCNVGIHPDGCLLCVEHGTAAISKREEEHLTEISGGKIKVLRGGVDMLPAYDGGFTGAPRGNSRFKAHLESLHNLFHARLSHLPCYTGTDRMPPEESQGADYEFAQLIRRAHELGLPQSVIDRLTVGNTTWLDFEDIYRDVVAEINARTDHNLEGWERNIITEVRFAPNQPWIKADRRMLGDEIFSKLTDNPLTHRVRKASPQEIWNAGAGKLVRLNFANFADFCAEHDAFGVPVFAERRVDDHHQITVRADAQNPLGYVFTGIAEDPRGNKIILEQGRKYKTLFNPFSPNEMLVMDKDGLLIGTCRDLVKKESKTDTESLARSAGMRRGIFARLLSPADSLAAENRERKIRALEENARIVAENKLIADAAEAEFEEIKRAALAEGDDSILDAGMPMLPAPEKPIETHDDCDDFLENIA